MKNRRPDIFVFLVFSTSAIWFFLVFHVIILISLQNMMSFNWTVLYEFLTDFYYFKSFEKYLLGFLVFSTSAIWFSSFTHQHSLNSTVLHEFKIIKFILTRFESRDQFWFFALIHLWITSINSGNPSFIPIHCWWHEIRRGRKKQANMDLKDQCKIVRDQTRVSNIIGAFRSSRFMRT